MANEPNLKIGIKADTSDWEKGSKAVKQGLNDLSKTGSSALSALGNAFGVNTGKVEQMVSSMKGLGQKMSECGNQGVAAFGNILKSIGPLGGAIAGIGLGAAIVAFKELKGEAEAFKNTVAGANYEMATSVYVDTYKQILRDLNGDTGKAIAETESKWKKFWGTLGGTVKALFSTGAWMGASTPGGQDAMNEYLKRVNSAKEGAQKAQDLTNQIYSLERKRKENAVEVAKINDQISDQMKVIKDGSASVAERNAAIVAAETLIAQKKTLTVDLEQQLATLYKQRSDIATDDVASADATLAQEQRAYETSRAINQEELALIKAKSTVGKLSEAQTKRLKEQKELEEKIASIRAKWADVATPVSGPSLSPEFPGVTGPQMSIIPKVENKEYWRDVINAQLGDITIGIGFEADTDKIVDITNEVNSLISSSVTRSAELIGNLIGTLAGGGDAWGDFKNAALSAFADMAIAVGKIAISTGLASEGIKAALKLGNPYVAIAAGAALVALGAAVKSGLSAVASGDYSAGAGGYSGGGASGGSSDYETRDINVNVTGTLAANGDQLIAVINSSNKKSYYTQ